MRVGQMYSLSPSTHIGKTDIQKNIVKEIAIREPGKMSSKLIPLTRDYYRQNFKRGSRNLWKNEKEKQNNIIKWQRWTHKVQCPRLTKEHFNNKGRGWPEMEVKVEGQSPNTNPLHSHSSKYEHLIVFCLLLHRWNSEHTAGRSDLWACRMNAEDGASTPLILS